MGKTVAVLGGDGRQAHLAQLLRRDGWDTVTWGAEEEQAQWSPETAADVPLGRSTAVNLIEGSLTDVIRFLDGLSAAENTEWREALHRSNGYRTE